MAELEIDRLEYRYQGCAGPALSDVSVKIGAGEFVAVIGANNSGKSTLCYALAGVIPHLFHGEMKGRVLLDGRNLASSSVGDIALDVGLVLQRPAGQMSGICNTVYEEVAFGLENRGVTREDIRRKVEEVLMLIGLEELASRSPFHLSGGEQQRLALATVLAVNPAILVLDEPTTFLDPHGAKLVFDILYNLQQKGISIVIAEQRLDLVAEYAGRVVAFAKGRVVMDASPGEVLTSRLIKDIGLDWTRYTRTADIAKQKGLWPENLPLSTSLSDTVQGFSYGREKNAD